MYLHFEKRVELFARAKNISAKMDKPTLRKKTTRNNGMSTIPLSAIILLDFYFRTFCGIILRIFLSFLNTTFFIFTFLEFILSARRAQGTSSLENIYNRIITKRKYNSLNFYRSNVFCSCSDYH